MTPSKAQLTTRGSSTTEAALADPGASQLYISLGDTKMPTAPSPLRIYHKPLCLDLVGARLDGIRRPAVALGPAAARWRAEACKSLRGCPRIAAGAGGVSR